MPKVNGSVRTTAMAMVKPGMAPAIRPPATPTIIRMKVLMVPSSTKAARMFSIITSAFP